MNTQPISPVLVSSTESISGDQLRKKVEMIKDLGNNSQTGSLENLLRLLQFDARGEIAIHASLSLAGRQDKKEVVKSIEKIYGDALPLCSPGYPPRNGDGVFPKMRLLYPFAWLGNTSMIKNLLDSGAWPGAMRGREASYDLIPAIQKGQKALADQLSYFEYLDEAGYRPIMDYTLELYPWANFTSSTWDRVRGGRVG